MTVGEIGGVSRPQSTWSGVVDVLRGFPRQARLALGVRGVTLATMAGIVGVLCCIVSLVVIVGSLHGSEIERNRSRAAAILELDQNNRVLMRSIYMPSIDRRQPPGDPAAAEALAAVRKSLVALCDNLDGTSQHQEGLKAVCEASPPVHDRLAAQLAARAGQRGPIDADVVGDLVALNARLNAMGSAAARSMDSLLGRVIDEYGYALLVLTFSTAGFAGAGLTMILLVGHASMRHHEQFRKAAEAAEQAARVRDSLHEIIESLPAGVVVYDPGGRLRMFNSTAAALTPALREPDAIGRTYAELAHETARRLEAAGHGPQPVAEWIDRFHGKGQHRQRMAGDGRWFDWSEQRTPSGLVVGLRVDVTEIKNHEQALEQARLEYQSLVDSLPDIVCRIDLKTGVFTFVGGATVDLFGLPAARLEGAQFRDFIAPEDDSKVLGVARAAYRSVAGEVFHVQFRVRRPDGTARHVEARWRRLDGDGAEPLLTGVITDIEDHVRLERRLEEEAMRQRSIIESSGALIVLADRDLRITMINGGFMALTGLSEEAVIGKPLQDVLKLPPDALEFATRQTAAPLDGGSRLPARFAVKIRDTQRRVRLIAVTATPVTDPTGHMVSLVLLGVDDTDRREAERALHESERFATVGEMAGTMAHELSQPLQVINIACAAAREEMADATGRCAAPDRAYVVGKLDRISQQIVAAARIIGDLRDFVRGTADKQAEPFDPAAAVRGAIGLTGHGVRQAGMALSTRQGDSVPAVVGHIGRLEQVLVNLINNARDAGGLAIDISTDVVRRDDRNFVRITVEDSGTGIPDDLLPQLFHRFVTTKPQGMGAGLGLRICRRIVDEMDGEISAANRPQGGACFEILLPAADARR